MPAGVMNHQCRTGNGSAQPVQRQCTFDPKAMIMHPPNGWTGQTASALQAALRMTNESFAEHLGIAVRTVAGWHQKPTLRPKSEMQRILDATLDQATQAVRDRFAALLAELAVATVEPATPPPAEPDPIAALDAEADVRAALDWLDRQAGWPPGTNHREVETRIATTDPAHLRNRRDRRITIGRAAVADALATYYGAAPPPHGLYAATYGSQPELVTSVLTHPDWLDLACPLHNAAETLTVVSTATADLDPIDSEAAGHAAQRLAEVLAVGGRMVDLPLYRLLTAQPAPGALAGTFGLSHFLRYALTLDLLEGELLDALARQAPTVSGALPLRDRYLPDQRSVLDLPGRLCAGGALSLLAIARPPGPGRPRPDYLILVQERSGAVLNAARRLAVIPKGFHQPMADIRGDAHLAATIRREIEEELFGREDIDSTLGNQLAADPMHPSRLSEPLRWLDQDPVRLRMECVAFGLNLVSGNYEFACLTVIEDDDFWPRFGGLVTANWEASALRQFSTRDPDLIGHLVRDNAWSNEGLFALLQGLRRLQQTDNGRVTLPPITWGIR
jgi:DNA-binding transcriptional regulator YiaG